MSLFLLLAAEVQQAALACLPLGDALPPSKPLTCGVGGSFWVFLFFVGLFIYLFPQIVSKNIGGD